MKRLDAGAKKKILRVLFVALCIVLVALGWPRKLSRLVPADQVESIYITWFEDIHSDPEKVTLTGEQVKAFFDHWEGFFLQITTPRSIFMEPTYHMHLNTGSSHFDILVSAEGVVMLRELGGREKFYYAKPWNDQSPTQLEDFIRSLE